MAKLQTSDGFMGVPGEKMMADGPMKHPVWRPTFTVPVSSIPEANKWQVGKTYRVELVVKQISIRESRFDDKGPTVEFEIHKIKAYGKK